ncbi:MAG TPA: YaiO family outer membrane beta-barrel protein [Pyrinomonadaceae bacterium]|nr:YaiO family outer membrane beta-barrel protein [Pyrinomonadaceae bacterium]
MKKSNIFFNLLFLFLFGSLSGFAQTANTTAQTAQAENSSEETKKDEDKKPKYEAQFHFTNETLSRNLGTWRTASLYIERKFDSKQIVWANFRASERRGIKDREFVFGTYKPLANKWAVTAETMFSPTHKFVGKYSVMGEVEKVLKKGFVAHGGVRFTNYDTVNATTGYGLVEKYWGSNRAAYTLFVTKLSNAGTAPSHRVQYTRYYGERVNSIGTAVSFGRELENLGPGVGVLRSKTWSVSVSARHWITNNFGIVVDGWVHRQGDIYYRRGLNFGVRYRF